MTKLKIYNPSSSHASRARQGWQIMVAMAMNRQTTTYERLMVLMYGENARGKLDRVLLHIACYCIDNSLPTLTSLVLGRGAGQRDDLPAGLDDMDECREHVYRHDWPSIYPPLREDFRASFDRHR